MRFTWLLCAGCWTAPVAPAAPPVAGTCTIRDTEVDAMASLVLAVHGEAFATVAPPFSHLEVTVAGPAARGRVETAEVILDGEVGLADFPVRPRGHELRDGWVQIDTAHGLAALGASLRIGVPLPEGVRPRRTAFVVPCHELTFAKAEEHPVPDSATYVELLPSTTTKLVRTPGGETLATIVAPPARPPAEATPGDGPISARVLERRAGMLHVRIEDPNAVEGWIAASATREPEDGDVYGGLMGGVGDHAGEEQSCARALPIFVRVGKDVTRVGKLKADAPLHLAGSRRGPEVALDLGESKIRPFVRAADLASCGL